MTLSGFRALYPEFERAPDSMISAWLGLATSELTPAADKWGADLDLGIGLLTAARLASSPSGQNARLTSDKDSSTYQVAFDELRVKRACGLRVAPILY